MLPKISAEIGADFSGSGGFLMSFGGIAIGATSLGSVACSRVTAGAMQSRRLPPQLNLFLSTREERIGELAASEFRCDSAICGIKVKR